MGSTSSQHVSFRPLTVLTFRLNHYFFGFSVFWFHFVNVVLHGVMSVLVTHLSLHLLDDSVGRFVAYGSDRFYYFVCVALSRVFKSTAFHFLHCLRGLSF